MRTTVEIDDQLIALAMKLTGIKTKRAVVERGLQQLVASAQRPNLASLLGKDYLTKDYDHKALRVGELEDDVLS